MFATFSHKHTAAATRRSTTATLAAVHFLLVALLAIEERNPRKCP